MFQRFLLAIDETTAGELGVSFASALARKCGASVHVFHANEFLPGGRGLTVETHEEAAHVVDGAVDQLRAAGVEASGECSLANCFTLAPRIADAAALTGADVIVMGSHRRRRFVRLFGRGIRERVSRITPLPVLTAPAPLRLGRRGPEAEVRRLAQSVGSTLGA
jgi:nucleotide-binding universal stress UspA family protein